MAIDSEEIEVLVATIWSSMLGLEVRPTDEEVPAGSGDFLTGCVHITGGWFGAVTLCCSAGLARQAAGILFAVPPADATDEQVHDALGELANITGGNLKALLPGPCCLSLPTVTRGAEYRVHVLRSRVQARSAFRCDGGLAHVAVLERLPDVGKSPPAV
jgi:chemotaxis protein CheX